MISEYMVFNIRSNSSLMASWQNIEFAGSELTTRVLFNDFGTSAIFVIPYWKNERSGRSRDPPKRVSLRGRCNISRIPGSPTLMGAFRNLS
jgi:hypothetical protein